MSTCVCGCAHVDVRACGECACLMCVKKSRVSGSDGYVCPHQVAGTHSHTTRPRNRATTSGLHGLRGGVRLVDIHGGINADSGIGIYV